MGGRFEREGSYFFRLGLKICLEQFTNLGATQTPQGHKHSNTYNVPGSNIHSLEGAGGAPLTLYPASAAVLRSHCGRSKGPWTYCTICLWPCTTWIYFPLSWREEATGKTFKVERPNWGTRGQTQGEEGKLGEGTGLTSNQFQDKDVPLGGSEMGDTSSSNEEHPSQQSRSGDTLKKNNIAFQGQWWEWELPEGQKPCLMHLYNFFLEEKDGGWGWGGEESTMNNP